MTAVVGIFLGVGGCLGSTGAAPEDLPGTSVGRNRPDDDEDDAAAEGIACCFLLSGITSVVFGSAVAGRAFGGTGGFFSHHLLDANRAAGIIHSLLAPFFRSQFLHPFEA